MSTPNCLATDSLVTQLELGEPPLEGPQLLMALPILIGN